MKIIISGACGRMGRQVGQEAALMEGMEVVAGVDKYVTPLPFAYPVYPAFDEVCEVADALIDFSAAGALNDVLTFALQRKLPVVLAATGYSAEDIALIEKAAEVIPVFRTANLSLGVQVLISLAKKAAAMLPGFDIEIIEKHHNQKADAPSGTAKMVLAAVTGENTVPVYGRSGNSCKRKPEEISVHAVRGGTVAGEHEIGFYGQKEIITISHSAQDRSVFAVGALHAARFIAAQTPGCYNMTDLVGNL